MKLISSNFANGAEIPSKYTCDGENINPEFKIKDIPKNTNSLVLIMDDPDALKPAGKVWDHWIVFNIPSDTVEISEGQEPTGIHGKGTGGNLKYSGPCPPDKEHNYVFKIYALDSELKLTEGTIKAEIENAMQNHILDKAELVGKYKRVR